MDQRPLPQGWISQYDPASGKYFFIDTTKQPPITSWEDPRNEQYTNESISFPSFPQPYPTAPTSSLYPPESQTKYPSTIPLSSPHGIGYPSPQYLEPEDNLYSSIPQSPGYPAQYMPQSPTQGSVPNFSNSTIPPSENLKYYNAPSHAPPIPGYSGEPSTTTGEGVPGEQGERGMVGKILKIGVAGALGAAAMNALGGGGKPNKHKPNKLGKFGLGGLGGAAAGMLIGSALKPHKKKKHHFGGGWKKGSGSSSSSSSSSSSD
ncbi:hypothetical protein G9A89_014964 [Geosiphon pyriformis]|nr:hypothetical protein G9A89_014964 [Geosiphon pyriformis]